MVVLQFNLEILNLVYNHFYVGTKCWRRVSAVDFHQLLYIYVPKAAQGSNYLTLKHVFLDTKSQLKYIGIMTDPLCNNINKKYICHQPPLTPCILGSKTHANYTTGVLYHILLVTIGMTELREFQEQLFHILPKIKDQK